MTTRAQQSPNAGLRRRSRMLRLIWGVGAGTLLLLIAVSRFFVIPLVALLLVLGVSLMLLRCCRCGHPIHRRRLKIGNVELSYWSAWLSKRCPRCQAEID